MSAPIVYFNGEFVRKDDVRISPDDRGFLLADGVYEVIRTYGGRMFLPRPHFDRLARSLAELRISGCEQLDFSAISRALIEKNGGGQADGVVYLQVTRGVAPRSHRFPSPAPAPTVYGYFVADTPQRQPLAPAAVVTASDPRWARCDIKSIALLPNVLAHQQAREQGADEVLFLRDGFVTEGSHTSFFAVIGDTVLTHPADSRILRGVTQQAVLELCRRESIPVQERTLAADELAAVDEAFLSGTTSEIRPIVTIDGRAVGTGEPGPVTQRLREAFAGFRADPPESLNR